MVSVGYLYLSEGAHGDTLALPLQHLTHLIVAFADVAEDLRVEWTPTCDPRALKATFPGLKVLLAVGGWTGSGRFSDAALTAASRRHFAASATDLLRTHGFDGLDVDWEFPATGGLPENSRRPEDRQNYTLLLKTLRQVFDTTTGPDRLLLTAAHGAGRNQVEALETDQLAPYLDWMNLMTYDFHGSWNPEPGDNSSLADTEASVRLHLERGFPAAQLVVGTPLYAHQWVVDGSGWGAGPVLLWHEAEALRTSDTFVWDVARGASRLVFLEGGKPSRVVTYDSSEALAAKVDLVRRLGLGGLMTWQVTGDPEGRQLERLGAPQA